MADKAEIESRIKEALEMFRPQLQADGGDMEYKGLDDQMRVHLVLTGACGSCPMAVMTLKMGVETYIKDAVPEVTEVVQDFPEGYEPPEYGMEGMGGF
ncbi:MAG: NifU family protein [Treponema sp.]|nr:NifU family protein [Treponema sp.]